MSTTIDDPRLENDPVEPTATTTTTAPPEQEGATSAVAPLLLREEKPLTRADIIRPALGALSTTLGCAFLVGGMFVGVTPRFYAAIGGIVGVAMAVWAALPSKRPNVTQALSLLGILLLGMILLGISDFGAIGRIGDVVGEAAKDARLRRPPANFDLGWRAILPWTVGMIGYAAAWVGSVGRKPAVGVLVPIPVIAFSAIAQPDEAQIPAGIVAFLSFVIGLAVIYRADRGEGDGVSTSFELKRAAKTAPLVIALTVGLILASQAGFLFPEPIYDPTQRAQLPRATPLSAIQDRVLFETHGDFTGPWRAGILDVYFADGTWRIPPFAESALSDAPTSGLIGEEAFENPVPPQINTRVVVGKLDGTILPLPARLHGVQVIGPRLVVDKRTESVRVKEGQVDEGLEYTAVHAQLPTEEILRTAPPPNADILQEYTDTSRLEAPRSVKELVAKAEAETDNDWDKLDFIRTAYRDVVTATGQGLPVALPPQRIEDMFTGSKEASPYEFIAAQALIARWAGIPARIGYGFDRGEKPEGSQVREFRPKHGASWLEVYFQGHGWFPITGLPKRAQASTGSTGPQNDADILPSDEIAVQLFVPLRVPPKGVLLKQIQAVVLIVLPFAIVIGLVWLLWPAAYKARRRSKRRAWAMSAGRAARIAVAYTDLRDQATDLGVGDPYATPLAYVTKVVPDDEHRELAWLVTRTLWGDLRDEITDNEVFAAEELSRSIRRRLFEAQPFTIRGISVVSRLSLRNPYAPELLSPALERHSLGSWIAAKLRFGRKRTKKKESYDEVTQSA